MNQEIAIWSQNSSPKLMETSRQAAFPGPRRMKNHSPHPPKGFTIYLGNRQVPKQGLTWGQSPSITWPQPRREVAAISIHTSRIWRQLTPDPMTCPQHHRSLGRWVGSTQAAGDLTGFQSCWLRDSEKLPSGLKVPNSQGQEG